MGVAGSAGEASWAQAPWAAAGHRAGPLCMSPFLQQGFTHTGDSRRRGRATEPAGALHRWVLSIVPGAEVAPGSPGPGSARTGSLLPPRVLQTSPQQPFAYAIGPRRHHKSGQTQQTQ